MGRIEARPGGREKAPDAAPMALGSGAGGVVPSFALDGRAVTVAAGRTLLEACRENGVPLPTLCHLEGVRAAASCRLCLVAVKGLPRPVPACSTRAWEGMVVTTSTPALVRERRQVVELLFASGHHVCAWCPANGSCELQDLARQMGLDHLWLRSSRPARALDASRGRFLLDRDRCVLCTRCVRVCAEVEKARTLSVSGRGARSRVVVDGGVPWGASATCTDCGRCAAACPTGAIQEKALAAQGLRPAAAPAPAGAPAPWGPEPARRARLATVWLGGCSGCHMSLLDLDEGLLELAPRVELVFSPFCDAREYPEGVDLCLVEGAVANQDHEPLLRRVRERTRVLVALGDCAANGNVTAMRDAAGGPGPILRRACVELAEAGAGPPPGPDLPALLPRVRPVADLVPVDLHLPGCPPSAGLIRLALAELLAGRAPDLAGRLRFG
jgi:bidirectional [NiFe] hydrogenase diaphorase subunit